LPDTPPRPSSALRAAFTGAAWLGLLNGLGGVAVLVLGAYLNRALIDARVQVGEIAVAATMLLGVSFVFELGIAAALMQRRELSAGVTSGLSRILLAMAVVGGAAMYVASGPIASLFDTLPHGEMTTLLRLQAPALTFILLGLPPKALLQRDLRFRRVATIEGASTLAYVAAAALVARSHGAAGVLFAGVLRHALETVAYWWSGSLPLAVLRHAPDWRGAREPLRFALSMGAQTLFGPGVRQFEVAFVELIAGQSAVYRQVQLFVVQPYSKLVVYVTRAAFPAFARIQDDAEHVRSALLRMQRLCSLLVFPSLAGLAAVAPRLLLLYLGPQFQEDLPEAVATMRIMCVGACAFTYASSVAVALNALGAAGRMLPRQGVGSVMVLAAMAAGAPGGLVGIGLGRTLALAALAALFLQLARSLLGLGLRDAWVTVRESLPASIGLYVLVTGAGLVMDRALPGSAPAAGESARGLAVAALAGQVLLGVAAYPVLLRALGVDVIAEIRQIRGRRPTPEPPTEPVGP
jgi:PST family polysaccharide transporter